MDSVGRCQVGFVSWHLVNQMGKYNDVLAKKMDVYSTADKSNYRRQKVHKNHGFAKAVLVLVCNATKEAEEEVFDAKISKKMQQHQKKTQKRNNNIWEEKISRNKENAASLTMLLYKRMTVI